MLKFDLWRASPIKFFDVLLTDICCDACAHGVEARSCGRCKWRHNPISLAEILDKRRKY